PETEIRRARATDPLAPGNPRLAREHPVEGGRSRSRRPLRDRRGIRARARARRRPAARGAGAAAAGTTQSAAFLENRRGAVAGCQFRFAVDPVALKYSA